MTISPILNSVIGSVIRPVIGDGDFYPNQLPNAAVGLDAFTLPSNTTLISSWRNMGNMGVGNATQATALRQPLYVANAINGRPALRGWHDGANNSNLTIADSAGLDYTSFEIYAVVRRHGDAGGDERICGKSAPSAPNREFTLNIAVNDNIVGNVLFDGTTNSFASSNAAKPEQTIVLNQPRIIRQRFDVSLGLARHRVFVNNNDGDFSSNPTSVNQTTEPLTLFSRTDFANGLRADIGELWFFTRILLTQQRTLMLNYLSAKWGIAI